MSNQSRRTAIKSLTLAGAGAIFLPKLLWANSFRKKDKIGVNALWPRTTIATAAVQNLLGGDALINMSRTPEIIADSVYYILCRPAESCNGNFFIDEEVLAQAGITDLEKYSVIPGAKLYTDLFL